MSEQDINTGTLENGGRDIDREFREAMVADNVRLQHENAALRQGVKYLELCASANVALGFCAGTAFLADPKTEDHKRAHGLLEARAATWGDESSQLAAMLREPDPVMSAEYGRIAETMQAYAAK